jgi:hypothetical protein
MHSPATEPDKGDPVTVNDEFHGFARDLAAAAPDVVVALRAAGEDIAPDLEVPTLWMGAVGHAIAQALPRLDPATRTTVFGLVERLLGTGSELTRTALTTGLLEAVAAEVSAGRLSGPDVAAVLGPRSRAYIDAWDEFSLGRSSLGDER